MTEPRPLYRSQKRVLFGICGSIADYLGIDATLVRVITVILTIMGCGIPILIYLVAIALVPERPAGNGRNSYINVEPSVNKTDGSSGKRRVLRIVLLIALAVAAAFGVLGFVVGMFLGAWQFDFAIFAGLASAFSVVWFVLTTVLPLSIVIAALVFLLVTAFRPSGKKEAKEVRRRLSRSSHNKKLGGVCGGVASYLKADPLIVRVVVLIAAVPCWYVVVPLYIVFWAILPIDSKNYNTWV
jgi:phage shock protein PspC (stress-responsive transcriptional regulator)